MAKNSALTAELKAAGKGQLKEPQAPKQAPKQQETLNMITMTAEQAKGINSSLVAADKLQQAKKNLKELTEKSKRKLEVDKKKRQPET